MKQKHKDRDKRSAQTSSPGSVQGWNESDTTPQAGTASVIHLEFPPPEYLLERARGEPNRKLVEDYNDTIRVLRDEKGFTFREIADWLTENGVEADHNAVYRAYTKGMPESEVAQMDQQVEEESRED